MNILFLGAGKSPAAMVLSNHFQIVTHKESIK